MSSNCDSNTDKKNINKVKDKKESTDPKALNDGDILRTKRIYSPSSTSETILKEENAKKIEPEKEALGRTETNSNKNERKKEEETKAETNNKNNSQSSQDGSNNFLASFKKSFIELREQLFREFKQENSREFFLINRTWFRKLNDFVKNSSNNNQNIKEVLGKIKNDEILDKQVLTKALFLNDEDKKDMKILKPRYYFCNYHKPIFLNRKLWEFLYKIFGGGPEVKILSEPRMGDSGNIIYKREIFKYIKINCIILPSKKNNSNIKPISMHDISRSNCSYKKKLMNDIQTFYFFEPKNINISDLISHTKSIIKKYTYIKVNDINNIRCWIDLNYDNFDKLLEKIEEKICFLYNMFDINPSSPLNLDKQEKEEEKIYSKYSLCDSNIFEFGFKLYPLSTFSHEILINIFPNQFTNNFEESNKFIIEDLNQKIKNLGIGMFDLSKMPIFNIYPELNIIIEQGVNTLFYKAPKIKYKLCEPCGCMSCTNRGLFTIFCKCGNKVYCSYKCKFDDRDYHEEECEYLLLDYFVENNENIENQLTEKSLFGIKGIRNIGNTCYMNTAIQCLSNCAELRNYFLFGNPHKDINKDNILGYKGLMAYGFEYIIRELWLEPDLVIDIDKFKKAVGNCNDRFRGMSQQDTHEFVTFLIDSLHEDLNRVKEKKYIEKEERELPDEVKSKIEWNNYLRRNQSILVDLFYGQFKSTVTCSECKKSCIDFNIFSSLSVNLKNINKKTNSEEISNKIDKLNINSRESSGIKNNNKINIDEDKENKSTNQKIENSSEKITFNRNENFSINSSPLKKEGVLVGGKPNGLETTSTNNDQDDSDIIIPLVFFFYSTEEKPISFTLPIKNIKELTYKVLLLKISKIFNKDPYSLYLYHISSGDKNIINIYGNNNFSVYDHKNKKVLYVSEINSSIIEKNALSNSILYSSRLPMFSKAKYLSRPIIEKELNDNKENIIKYINNVIDEKNDCNDIEDKYLYSHFMSLEKVFQFTLKNYIYDEENKSIKCHYFPKIVVFSKDQTFYNLYCEIITMNKIIILDNESKNNPTEIINALFKYLLETPKEKVNKEKIFNDDDNNLPFYICVQKFNEKSTDNNNDEVLLLLNEQEKNKKLIDILGDIKDQNDIVTNQILLKIIWNPKYNTKLKNLIKPEKIDGFFNTLIGLNEKKNDINKLLNNPANKIPTNEEVLLATKNHYTQLYEMHLNNNNNNSNNNNNGYIYNGISSLNDEDKNVKSENTDNTENTINTLNSTNNSNKKENKDNVSQINSEISLDDSLDILREEELLDENNEWFCENCKKKQRAIKKIEIYNAPKILIIQIKRFSQRDKINTKVNFPLTDLDISNYILSKEKDKKIKYDLFAVANHYGSLYFGHYTAFCKNSITNKWFEFNDSSVIEIDDESKIISHNAYVLFYKQKDLSKLDWNQIYNKQFINIDIKDNNTLVDFNYDFKKNMKINVNETSTMQDSDKNIQNVNDNDNDNDSDMNEFDKKLKEIYLKKKPMKSSEMPIEKEETKENTDLGNENKVITGETKENDKNENMLLGKKRSSSEIN